MPAQILFGQRALGRDDEGFHSFTENLIRHADDGGLQDAGELDDDIFNLFGTDSVAAGFDHVASTSGEKNVTVLISVTKVASEIIAIAQHVGGALRIVP